MKTTKATARHEELRLAILHAMMPFDDVPAIEQLAAVAALVGQLIAMQDRTRYSSEGIMEMIAANIEMGNAEAITAAAMGVIKP
jgi:hypothetical protein